MPGVEPWSVLGYREQGRHLSACTTATAPFYSFLSSVALSIKYIHTVQDSSLPFISRILSSSQTESAVGLFKLSYKVPQLKLKLVLSMWSILKKLVKVIGRIRSQNYQNS